MNQEDILRMALEANFWGAEVTAPPPTKFDDKITIEEYSVGDKIEHFAKLVAAHEREACARIVEGEACAYSEPVWAVEIVNDIRARGEA